MEPLSPKPQHEAASPVRPELPVYQPPEVTSYTDEELLEALGPAQARQYGPPP